MIGPRFVWIAFSLCVIVVAAVLGWISRTALELERAEARATRQSENERLALWRMDSILVPLVARESARSAVEYREPASPSAAPAAPAAPVAQAGQTDHPGTPDAAAFVQFYFQCSADGRWATPPVSGRPANSAKDAALLCEATTYEGLAQQIPEKFPVAPDPAPSSPFDPFGPAQQQDAAPQTSNVLVQQMAVPYQLKQQRENRRSLNEYAQRSKAATITNTTANGDNSMTVLPQPESAAVEAPMHAIWIDGLLVLARPARLDNEPVVQGCLLDWPVIRRQLLRDIRDLLPQADLVPVDPAGEASAESALRLAALPVRLVPGPAPLEPIPSMTPLRFSLSLAWGSLLVAALAVGGLLFLAVRLSERRGAFVSAVTHELRTPLTTFRLYTEMLAEEMVPDAQRRRDYLRTLRVEAERLGHLVENVLSYARLENTRHASRRERVDLPDLLGRLEGPLRERAARSEMRFDVRIADDPNLAVVADAAGIERILFNLVDNACKYAQDAAERRIEIDVRREGFRGSHGLQGSRVLIAVRDHGGGVGRREARRLFRPFSKSATEAAHSAPGVGLGLALCRRLARSMGGDLRLDHSTDAGARFVLSLPAAH